MNRRARTVHRVLRALAAVAALLAGTLASPPSPRAGDFLDPFPALPWSPTGSFPGQRFGQGVAPAGDVNGDGFGDVLVMISVEDTAQARAALFLGGPDGPSLVPAWTFSTQAEDTWLVRPAGDVNGDGHADVLVSRPFAANPGHFNGGRVAVFHGGPSGLPAAPTYERFSPFPAAEQYFGFSADYAGDVNGDGYADVVLGTPLYNDGAILHRGMACIFHGGPSGLDAAPARTLFGRPQSGRFGESAATAGDVNGDGFDDVIIGASEETAPFVRGGTVSIHFGSSGGIGAVADTVLIGLANDAFCGSSVSTAGDVNYDGYADVLFGSPGTNGFIGRADVALGGPDGIILRIELPSPVNQSGERWGRLVAALGDLDGDGLPEFAVGGQNAPSLIGHAVVYEGGPNIVLVGHLLPPPGAQQFALSFASSGDVDGDGRSEILVGDPSAGGTGRVELRGLHRTTTVTATGWPQAAEQPGTRFGNSLAVVQGKNFALTPYLLVGDPQFDGFGRVTEYRGGGPDGVVSTIDRDVNGTVNAQAFGTRVADAGDFNGDGMGDYVVSSPGINGGTFQNPISQVGRVDVVLGAISTQDLPVPILLGQREFDRIGSALAGRGDVNGDGYHDVLVGAREADTATLSNAGRAWVVFGGPAPPPPWTVEGTEAGQGLGAGVALLDLDGDGYTDVAIGSTSPFAGPQLIGRVQVHYGGPGGPANVPGLVLVPPVPSITFGSAVAALGDVSGDGVADLGVGAPLEDNRGVVRIYGGSLGRSQSLIPIKVYSGTQDGARFGEAIAGGGDIDGDGFGDFSIGQPGFDGAGPDVGRALLHFGAKDVPESAPGTILQSSETGAEMGASIAPLADVNGDGFADWAVASPGAVGRVHVRLGGGGKGRRHQLLFFDRVAEKVLYPPARNASDHELVLGLFPHAPMGRGIARIEVEVRTQNELFTGVPTSVTPMDLVFGSPGDESSIVAELDVPRPGRAFHLRARQVTRSPWFQRSTWSAFAGRVSGDHDVRFAGVAVDAGPATGSAHSRLVAVTPNPANRSEPSRISFALPHTGRATVDVFDVRGRRVRRVAEGEFPAGRSACAWDGCDEQGRWAPAGIYFVVLRAADRSEQSRVVRLP